MWEEIKRTTKPFTNPVQGIDCISALTQIAPQVKNRKTST